MKSLTVINILLLVWFVNVVSVGGQDTVPVESRALYTTMIDHYLQCKLTISQGLDSKMPVMRGEAKLALDKFAFCQENRNDLIQALIDNQVEPKPYKVELFINQKYRQNREEWFTAKKCLRRSKYGYRNPIQHLKCAYRGKLSAFNPIIFKIPKGSIVRNFIN